MVVLIAANMVAEVCSVYVLRVDGTLELYATEGLKREAVHQTVLRAEEGLVGLAASEATPMNLSDAQAHPASLIGPKPAKRSITHSLAFRSCAPAPTLGVLVQNRARRTYTEEEERHSQTEGDGSRRDDCIRRAVIARAARRRAGRAARCISSALRFQTASRLAMKSWTTRVVITNVIADDVQNELMRFDTAIAALREDLDRLVEHRDVADGGEHRDVLEAYRMFSYDQGWLHRIREAVMTGLTAEASVERGSPNRARMLRTSIIICVSARMISTILQTG